MCFNPSLRDISLQLGGKIEETRTILHAAIPAFRSASSKLESLSRCFPTPLVRNIFLATNAMVPVCGASVGEVSLKTFVLRKSSKKVLQCQSYLQGLLACSTEREAVDSCVTRERLTELLFGD